MIKILANDGIAASGKEELEDEGFKIITNRVGQDDLIDYINNEDIAGICVRSPTKIRKDLIDACPGLKLIGRGGVGMDNIDVEYARDNGRFVFNTPNASSQSVAELTMAHIFTLARYLQDANRNMPEEGDEKFKSLKKSYSKGFELRGKTLGVIGMGRIGKSVAGYALGIGMNVIYYRLSEKSVTINVDVNGNQVEVPMDSSSREEVLSNADILTLHIPKTSDKPVIGAEEFVQMKQGSILINAARGGVVDEQALLDALNNDHLRAAGIDVYENEPTPNQDILRHPKISLSPHIGASTVEAQERIGLELAENIIDYFR